MSQNTGFIVIRWRFLWGEPYKLYIRCKKENIKISFFTGVRNTIQPSFYFYG